MKKYILTLILLTATGISSHAEDAKTEEQAPKSCFETIQEISPSISMDQDCVYKSSSESFEALCDADGVLKTKDFERYLVFKSEYDEAQAKVDKYFEENPGAGQVPQRLFGKLQNAENNWLTAGKKHSIENSIEKLRRDSVSCKDAE